jgi:hypothetical protein
LIASIAAFTAGSFTRSAGVGDPLCAYPTPTASAATNPPDNTVRSTLTLRYKAENNPGKASGLEIPGMVAQCAAGREQSKSSDLVTVRE